MYTDSVDLYHWVTATQFSSDFALARLSPGPATGVSALIGYNVGGFSGAVAAAAAMFVPAALIVLVMISLYERFEQHPLRAIFVRTMIPVVLGLTWVGVSLLGRGALGGWETWALMLGSCAIMLFTRINASLIIVAFGALGAVFLR